MVLPFKTFAVFIKRFKSWEIVDVTNHSVAVLDLVNLTLDAYNTVEYKIKWI